MKVVLALCLGLLSCMALPVKAADKVTTTVEELQIIRVPQRGRHAMKGAFGKQVGTLVKLRLVHPTKELIGVDLDSSKVHFTDSTGKDLLAEGRKAEANYKKNRSGFTYVSGEDRQNRLSTAERGGFNLDDADPKEVFVELHALATPDKKATNVSIRGELALIVEPSKQASVTVPVKSLGGKQPLKLGTHTLKFTHRGASGSILGRKVVELCYESKAVVKDVVVIGKSGGESAVDLGSFSSQATCFRVYKDEVVPEDKVKITYTVPTTQVVSIDVTVTAGFAGE